MAASKHSGGGSPSRHSLGHGGEHDDVRDRYSGLPSSTATGKLWRDTGTLARRLSSLGSPMIPSRAEESKEFNVSKLSVRLHGVSVCFTDYELHTVA